MALLTYGQLASNKPAWYLGATIETATDITPSIAISDTSGYIPCNIHVSIEGTTITGDSKPYGHLECSWDFGDSSNTKTVTDQFGKTVNLNNEQVGREAAYVYMIPGTYTITANYRIWNGSSFIAASTTQSVTINDIPSTALRMYISTDGNDSNDGNDPNGFNLTNATWTSSSKTLTKTGAFTSYNHSTATNPTYDLQKTNIIYISGGTSVITGWYKISGKTDNDSITLSTEITSNNSNPTNVSSSNGPKSSIANASTSLKTFIQSNTSGEMRYGFVRAGDTHSITSSISVSRVGRRIISYGDNTSNKANLNVDFSTSIVEMFSANIPGNNFISNYAFLGISFNLNDNTTARVFSWTSSGSGGVVAGYSKFCFVDCSFLNCASTQPVFNCSNIVDVRDKTKEFLWLNCNFSNPNIRKSHLFIMGEKWIGFLGCSFSGGNGNSILDHFIYPDHWEHRLFAYCNFGSATSLSYAINNNVELDTNRNYVDIRNNIFTGPGYGTDFSNSNNDKNRGDHSEFFCGDNLFKDMPKSPLLGYNVAKIYLARNLFTRSSASSYAFVSIGDPLSLDIEMWDNKVYNIDATSSYGALLDTNNSGGIGHITGNVYRLNSSNGVFASINTSTSSIAWDKNTFSGSGSTPFFDYSTSSEKSIAQWQSTGRDVDLVTTDPNWVDPANGVFYGGIPSLASTSNIIVALDTDSIDGGIVSQNSSQIDIYRLYNSGDKVLITDSNGIVVSGSATGTISGIITLYPGEYLSITITRNTSTTGSKFYTITVGSDAQDPIFTVTNNFTVNGNVGTNLFTGSRGGNAYLIFNG